MNCGRLRSPDSLTKLTDPNALTKLIQPIDATGWLSQCTHLTIDSSDSSDSLTGFTQLLLQVEDSVLQHVIRLHWMEARLNA